MTANSHMTEYPDRRVWALDGHKVTMLRIDNKLSIDIRWGSSALYVIIEAPFMVRHDGLESHLDPEHGVTLSPILTVLHQPVESLTAYRNGNLSLHFVSGDGITVEKLREFETWNTYGEGEMRDAEMRCTPHEGPPWVG